MGYPAHFDMSPEEMEEEERFYEPPSITHISVKELWADDPADSFVEVE